MRTKKVEKNTAAKKSVEKKAVAAVKPEATVAAAPVSEVKAEVKVEEPAKEETVAEVKPVAVAKKPAKAVAAKKTTTKTTAKKETASKAASKTTKTTKAAKAATQKIVLQVDGRELDMEGITERVKKAYADEGHSASSIKDIAIYIKIEEKMLYYVIDGYASGISLYE